jgi:hypothetical protein
MDECIGTPWLDVGFSGLNFALSGGCKVAHSIFKNYYLMT